jgi:hypothetical protein
VADVQRFQYISPELAARIEQLIESSDGVVAAAPDSALTCTFVRRDDLESPSIEPTSTTK